MTQLPELSKEQAMRLAAEVGFDDRLIGYHSSEGMGNEPFSLYSLQEVLNFLEGNDGNHINYLDLGELCDWVGRVLGDDELRQALAAAHEGGDAYIPRATRVAELIAERLEQTKSLASA